MTAQIVLHAMTDGRGRVISHSGSKSTEIVFYSAPIDGDRRYPVRNADMRSLMPALSLTSLHAMQSWTTYINGGASIAHTHLSQRYDR
jgi:hypothetical protein